MSLKTTKAFSRVNKQGKVVRIIREHYLRDDIWCNSQECRGKCQHENPILSAVTNLDTSRSNDASKVKKNKKKKQCQATRDIEFPALTGSAQQQLKKKQQQQQHNQPNTSPTNIGDGEKILGATTLGVVDQQVLLPIVHYMIPTVHLVLNYIEMFEVNQFSNIIFCETVLKEAQNNQTVQKRLPNRIRAIVNDTALRRSILYCNEHSKDTYVERDESNESQKQRDNRAVSTVAEWYRTHLEHKVPIVLVTLNEEESKEFANVDEGVIVMSIEQYINDPRYCAEKSEKADLKNLFISLTDAMNRRLESDTGNLYEEHLPIDAIESGIKNRLYIKGVIHVSKYNPQEAHIRLSQKGSNDEEVVHSQVIISGNQDRNRAVHGDVVAVQLLPENEWIKDENDPQTLKPKGRVIGILQRNWRDYVACLQVDQEERSSSDRYALCIPLDYRIPKIRIMTRQRDVLENSRIVVRINSWESNSTYPNGFYVRTLGPIGDLNVETEGLLIENGLDQVFKFSPQALSELPTHTPDQPYVIAQREIEQRRDIRKTHMVTSIDPIGCEDIDDALSVKFLPNNNIEIGVHIADVTHYVKHESHLDIEARARSTTIYLVDRRLDMLPGLLSADLCSLRMNEDRLAVSVFWEFKRTGELVSTWFGRTVIRSRYALHYAQAQNIINGVIAPPVPSTPGVDWKEAEVKEEDLPDLRKYLTILQQFARQIRKKRTSAGAIELESLDEVKIKLDESKEVKEIETKQDLEIHHTVAEWMIYANAAVAKKIYDCFPRSAILRRHPLPRMESFKTLIQAAQTRGFTIRTETNHALAESLEKAVDKNDPYVNLLLRALATRAMSEAVYFSTGSYEPNDFFHYGLALNFYTHFTSPIRRYSDILAHRMLLVALEEEKKGLAYENLMEHSKLEQICEHMNDRHRASKQAEGDSSDWFRALYIKKKVNLVDVGIIYNIKANALFIFVPTYRIKATVYITTREGDMIIPEKEQREYNVIESEPLNTLSSNPNVTFSTGFDEKKLKLTVNITRKSKNRAANTTQYSFRVFDHVKVYLRTNESRVHLPQVQLDLLSFEVNKTSQVTAPSKANLKKQLEEYSEQVSKEAQVQESKNVLQDTGFEQSVDNLHSVFMNLRVSSQPTTISSPSKPVMTEAPAVSSKYSHEELQKKLKAVMNRLKQIEKIKKKQEAEQPLTDDEKEKLSSESKYLTHLKKLQKLGADGSE